MKDSGTNILDSEFKRIMKRQTDIRKAIRYDFKKFITFQINYICECSEYCSVEGVCRQNKITDIQIQYINLHAIAEKIFSFIHNIRSQQFMRQDKLSELLNGFNHRLEIYGIERLLNNAKVYDINKWTYNVANGYYGQEIDSVWLSEDTLNELEDRIFKYTSYEDIKNKIEFLLKCEYGYVLPELLNCKYRISRISISEVYFGNLKRFNQSVNKNIYKSRNQENIMGICIRQNDVYKVIDGYNRMSQSKLKKIYIIEAYYE
jgi:hypothetical protein